MALACINTRDYFENCTAGSRHFRHEEAQGFGALRQDGFAELKVEFEKLKTEFSAYVAGASDRVEQEDKMLEEKGGDNAQKAINAPSNVEFEKTKLLTAGFAEQLKSTKELTDGFQLQLQRLEETQALYVQRMNDHFEHTKNLTDGVEKQLRGFAETQDLAVQRVNNVESCVFGQVEDLRQMRKMLYDQAVPAQSARQQSQDQDSSSSTTNHSTTNLIMKDTSFSSFAAPAQQPGRDRAQSLTTRQVDIDMMQGDPQGSPSRQQLQQDAIDQRGSPSKQEDAQRVSKGEMVAQRDAIAQLQTHLGQLEARLNENDEHPTPPSSILSKVDDAAKDPNVMLQTALEEACLYTLKESAWDAALLIGMHTNAPLFSLTDTSMLVLAVSVQASVQAAFCYIVVVLVEENQKGLQVKTDMSECNEQTADFQQYLDDAIGPLLAVLVVMIWTLSVLSEFRRIADFIVSVWNVPWTVKGEHTEWRVNDSTGRLTLVKISRGRVCLMVINALAQLVVASILLGLGSVWLSSTVVLADLLLNGVALKFIMDIDELMFHVLCSGKVKVITRHLAPLKLPTKMVMPGRVPVRSLSSLLFWVVFSAAIGVFVLVPNLQIMWRGIERGC